MERQEGVVERANKVRTADMLLETKKVSFQEKQSQKKTTLLNNMEQLNQIQKDLKGQIKQACFVSIPFLTINFEYFKKASIFTRSPMHVTCKLCTSRASPYNSANIDH